MWGVNRSGSGASAASAIARKASASGAPPVQPAGRSGRAGLSLIAPFLMAGARPLPAGEEAMVPKLDEAARPALIPRFPDWGHAPERRATTRRFRFRAFAPAFGVMARATTTPGKNYPHTEMFNVCHRGTHLRTTP